jgi:hypothetical protein
MSACGACPVGLGLPPACVCLCVMQATCTWIDRRVAYLESRLSWSNLSEHTACAADAEEWEEARKLRCSEMQAAGASAQKWRLPQRDGHRRALWPRYAVDLLWKPNAFCVLFCCMPLCFTALSALVYRAALETVCFWVFSFRALLCVFDIEKALYDSLGLWQAEQMNTPGSEELTN